MFLSKNNFLKYFALICFIYLLKFAYNSQNESIKGCIIILSRESDIDRIRNLIKNVDLTFNKKYKYPFVLFNDEEFSNNFKNEIIKHTNSTIEFGLIPKEHWNVPSWINETRLNESVHKIGHSVRYRQMCRFNSGFFFQHELFLKYDYFMRLDSDSGFECELNEDPFKRLKKNNQKYSFILDDNGQSLNGQTCIFYNNFEMAHFSVFRNRDYLNYFHSLDKTGGFFYERWVNYK